MIRHCQARLVAPPCCGLGRRGGGVVQKVPCKHCMNMRMWPWLLLVCAAGRAPPGLLRGSLCWCRAGLVLSLRVLFCSMGSAARLPQSLACLNVCFLQLPASDVRGPTMARQYRVYCRHRVRPRLLLPSLVSWQREPSLRWLRSLRVALVCFIDRTIQEVCFCTLTLAHRIVSVGEKQSSRVGSFRARCHKRMTHGRCQPQELQ